MKPLTLIDKAFFLKQTAVFNALSLDLLLTIADKLGLIALDPRDAIFVVQEEANRMYFIVEGRVEIQSEHDALICLLEKGDFFGDESLFNHKPRSYAAQALVETRVLTLSRTNLYTIISECPSVALGFLHAYASVLPCRSIVKK